MRFGRLIRFLSLVWAAAAVSAEDPSAPVIRLPVSTMLEGTAMTPGSPTMEEVTDLPSWLSGEQESTTRPLPISQAIAKLDAPVGNAVTRIPSFTPRKASGHRVVRYEVPLQSSEVHDEFLSRGIGGRLINMEVQEPDDRSLGDRLRGFFMPDEEQREVQQIQAVRYEVPAEEIQLNAHLQSLEGSRLQGEIVEPSMLRLPEVRFFQPKARVFMDLKSDNDSEFDLFDDGAILASLDVVELYFPMPLISERFGELLGTPSRLSALGWRVGGTVGLGIASALNNGSENGRAPVTTLSSGIRYEFPLGRPSREVLETGDLRLDQRTRVGFEVGIQGGVSTRESLSDRTDVGFYVGLQVDTPWGG